MKGNDRTHLRPYPLTEDARVQTGSLHTCLKGILWAPPGRSGSAQSLPPALGQCGLRRMAQRVAEQKSAAGPADCDPENSRLASTSVILNKGAIPVSLGVRCLCFRT